MSEDRKRIIGIGAPRYLAAGLNVIDTVEDADGFAVVVAIALSREGAGLIVSALNAADVAAQMLVEGS